MKKETIKLTVDELENLIEKVISEWIIYNRELDKDVYCDSEHNPYRLSKEIWVEKKGKDSYSRAKFGI